MALRLEFFPWYGMQKQEAITHWSNIAHEAYLWMTRENNRDQGIECEQWPASREWPNADEWPDGKETMADEYARACKAISLLNDQ